MIDFWRCTGRSAGGRGDVSWLGGWIDGARQKKPLTQTI
jgi:hypothetical protein